MEVFLINSIQINVRGRVMDDLSKKYFEKQIDFANTFQRYSQCKYYPCHSFHESQEYQNCLFCYCPIYPCENTQVGGKWINESTKPVWDCKECNFIHLDSTVKKILELFLLIL